MFQCGEGWLINLFSNHHSCGHIDEVHTQRLWYKREGAWSPQVALYHLMGLKRRNTRVRHCAVKKLIHISGNQSLLLLAEMLFILPNKRHRNCVQYHKQRWRMSSGQLDIQGAWGSATEFHLCCLKIRTESNPEFTLENVLCYTLRGMKTYAQALGTTFRSPPCSFSMVMALHGWLGYPYLPSTCRSHSVSQARNKEVLHPA